MRSDLKLLVGLFVMIIIAAGTVHAVDAGVANAGVTIIAPLSGDIVTPSTDRFYFSIQSGETISKCELIFNGQIIRSLKYNDVLRGRTLSFVIPMEDGNVTWQAICTTAGGEVLASEEQIVVVRNKVEEVTVTSNGIFRGSLTHSFKITNSAEQKSITITKLAAGDIIEIQLYVKPSTMKKELYIKQKSMKDGKLYLWLEDMKKNENYYLFQEENVTVNISLSKVVLRYVGNENNRATVVAYPVVNEKPDVGENPNTATDPKGQTDETDDQGATDNAGDNRNSADEQGTTDGRDMIKDDGTQNSDVKSAVDNRTGEDIKIKSGTDDAKTNDDENDVAKPGLVKRFLTWFVGIFG